VALPAYLSSVYATKSIVDHLLPDVIKEDQNIFYEQGVQEWKILVGSDSLPDNPQHQSEWDSPLYLKSFENLFTSAASEVEKARLLAVSSERSSDFLYAIPVPSLGLKLADSELRVACSLRLGSPICHPHKCPCGTTVDPLGRHGLSCKVQIGRHPRHSHINEIVKRALVLAEFPARREPTGLCRKDGKRPDGVTLFPFNKGKCLLWDATVVDTLADTYVPANSKSPGKAAERAEKSKLVLYEELCKDFIFTPIAVETLGTWGQLGLSLIKEIGRKLCNVTGERRSSFYLFQRISIAIQRGNAASVIGTVGSTSKLDEIFYL